MAEGIRALATEAGRAGSRTTAPERAIAAAGPGILSGLHPNLAELYRRQVEDLHSALTHPSTRDEAFAILRQLIERVSVHPREDGVEIELQGEIVAMVEVALGSDAAGAISNKAALRRLVLDDGSRRSVKGLRGPETTEDLTDECRCKKYCSIDSLQEN